MESEPIRPSASSTDGELLNQLRTIARDDLEIEADRIHGIGLDTVLADGLRLDSLNQVILLARIEDLFGVVFSLEDREQLLALRTVGDLVGLLQQRMGQGPGGPAS